MINYGFFFVVISAAREMISKLNNFMNFWIHLALSACLNNRKIGKSISSFVFVLYCQRLQKSSVNSRQFNRK